jgi:hypothetical protein
MEGHIGSAIFGIKIAVVHDQGFDLITIWAEIESVKPIAEQLPKPDVNLLASTKSADPKIAEIVIERRNSCFVSIAIVAVVSILAVLILPSLAAVIAIAVSLYFAQRPWKKGAAMASPYLDSYRSVSQRFNALNREWVEECCRDLSRWREESKRRADKEMGVERGRKFLVGDSGEPPNRAPRANTYITNPRAQDAIWVFTEGLTGVFEEFSNRYLSALVARRIISPEQALSS